MPRAVTAGSIITDARTLADEVNSTFITATEALQMVSQEYALLRDRLDRADPLLNLTTQSFTSVAGTTLYTLPSDFKSALALWQIRGTQRYPIDPFGLHERTTGDTVYFDANGIVNTRYRIRGQGTAGTSVRLEFDRDPGANDFELEYIPAPEVISSTADQIDGVSGWEERITYGVARRMLLKNQDDVSAISMMIAEIDQQIALMAAQRDSGRPTVVQDVRTRRTWW